MKFISRDRRNNYRASGIAPGRFVKIFQGSANRLGIIGHYDASRIGEESFLDFADKPDVTWGAGVYMVKDDLNLVHLGSDYDSSD